MQEILKLFIETGRKIDADIKSIKLLVSEYKERPSDETYKMIIFLNEDLQKLVLNREELLLRLEELNEKLR